MLNMKINGYESLIGGAADQTAGTAEVADWFWLLLCQSLSPQFMLQKKKIRENQEPTSAQIHQLQQVAGAELCIFNEH